MTTTPSASTDVPYTLTRLGTIMSADPTDPQEQEGVLNPGIAWGPDGELYLFPRLVAQGNRSVIARTKILIEDGVPVGVERQGVIMRADEGWERGRDHGGVEDPRITHVPALGMHVMTYVAFGPVGPRPAIAISRDTEKWERLGPLHFGYEPGLGTDLNLFPNKDVVVFPEVVSDPNGVPSIAVLHRPMWDLSYVRWPEDAPLPTDLEDERPGIWISYVPVSDVERDIRALTRLYGHREVAGCVYDWEATKIGAGPPPIRVPEGWLVLHHGVTGTIAGDGFTPQADVFYAAGALILDADDPSQVIARTPEPLMTPATEEEINGTVGNVVFPTAIEEIDGVKYVFYGMADASIGVARLDRV